MTTHGKLYRVHKPGPEQVSVLSPAELMIAIFAVENCREPRHPLVYTGQWYCNNEDCDARQITIRVKLLDGKPAKRPRCPMCSGKLLFDGYQQDITLLPAEMTPECYPAPDEEVNDNEDDSEAIP